MTPTPSPEPENESHARSSGLRVFATLASAVVAFLLALSIWNLFIGLWISKHPGWREDPHLGRLLKPGTFLQSGEGYVRTEINEFGMRNPPIGPKRSGRTRVLFLGDSFTAALQVADGVDFVDLLRSKLPSDQFELINGGRAAANPVNYLYGADYYKSVLNPDLVVVEMCFVNFAGAHPDELGELEDSIQNFYIAPDHDSFRLVRNKKFVSDNAFLNSHPKLRWLLEIPAAEIAARNVSRMMESPRPTVKFTEEQRRSVPRLARWIVQQLHKTYPRLAIVYIARSNYFLGNKPVDDVTLPMGDEAKSLGIPFVDVTDLTYNHFLRTHEMANGFSNFPPGTGHLNDVGHRIVADALAPILREMR